MVQVLHMFQAHMVWEVVYNDEALVCEGALVGRSHGLESRQDDNLACEVHNCDLDVCGVLPHVVLQ